MPRGPIVSTKLKRINFVAPEDLCDRSQRSMSGMRSMVLRSLLEKVCDAVEKDGMLAAGAIIDGHFDLVPKIPSASK